jgi:16S rRNA A1518/A1519 N6-dimethyltransferase RsmA/KsgA/DIM1 with predicted DNA glycosylase/AP lyase activity
VRFRQVRPHEERPVRPKPSVGSVVIALTVRPPEQLPAGVEFEDVIERVINAIRKPLGEWYETDGHDLLLCAPDVA